MTTPTTSRSDGARDDVDEASRDSFPASDAPGWTGAHAGPPTTGAEESPKQTPSLRSVRVQASVEEAVSRLERGLKAAGMKVFARIDQSAEARAAGMSMRPTVVLLFGNPAAGTPLMLVQPTVAIDLPLKALVWQDDNGVTWLTYNTPQLLEERHGLSAALASKVAPASELLERLVRGG